MNNKIQVKNLVLKRNLSTLLVTNERFVLKGINAEFKSGTMSAILAPNGHGKSTFLNALFGKVDSEIMVSGDILFNGEERDVSTWFEDAFYVEQKDYELENQTVREALEFSARIRDINTKDEKYKIEYMEMVNALNLNKVLDKKIESISGGEKKRTMIVIELLANKKVLILDEPTSDLDSTLALNLLKFLKKKAVRENLIIVFSIHQPSDRLFETFDNILVINEGIQIYSGERKEFLPFLKSKGIVKPDNLNVSDFTFDLAYGIPGKVDHVASEIQTFKREISDMSYKIVKESNPVT